MERRPGKKVTVCADGNNVDGRAAKLTAEEERVVRMAHGLRVDPAAPLARHASGGSELADELSIIELGLFRSHRKALRPRSSVATVPVAADERAKSKIIRALRRKR